MRPATEISELVKRVQKGDMLAAELLYERYAVAMYLVSFRITNNKETSEDILQEVFVKSFTCLNNLKDKNRYGGWLKRMIVNASIDAVKAKRNWENIDDHYELTEEEEEAIPGISPEVINRAITALPEKCRTVFSLYLIEGYSHAEVADLLDIALSTSKSQYQYALKLLRKMLKERRVQN